MNVAAFLSTLRERDVQVWADGAQLRCSAPVGGLGADLRAELREHKAEILDFLRSAGALVPQTTAIVPLQPRGSRPPAFAFGGHNGDVFCFRAFVRHLGVQQPFFGLQPPGLDGRDKPLQTVEDLASYFAAEIHSFGAKGPYIIVGFCAGGTIAFELARQLIRDGASVSFLALLGAPFPTAYRRFPRMRKRIADQGERMLRHTRALAALPYRQRWRYVVDRLLRGKPETRPSRPAGTDPVLIHRARVERAMFAALRRYVPDHFDGLVHLLLPCEAWAHSHEEPLRWRSVAQRTELFFGPHNAITDTMLLEPHASTFAATLLRCAGGSSRDATGAAETRCDVSYAAR